MLATSAPPLALASPISVLLDKPAAEFTRDDLLDFIVQRQVESLAFHYTAIDGKLKELKLPISSLARAERLLAEGERADGSSIFPGVVEPGASDVYLVPVYRSAFVNPFDSRTLGFVCRFFDRDGNLAAFAPDNILHRTASRFQQHTGLQIRALGELEFYLVSENSSALYPSGAQRGYHATTPFVKSGELLDEMARLLEQITGAVKYGHGEVGWIGSIGSDNIELAGKTAEQFEIEFLPLPIEECADALVLARWLIRSVAHRHRCLATFAPKLEEGAAGNGMHFHLELQRDGLNAMTVHDGELSPEALTVIGGLCHHAEVLTAFGNTMAASYLRLVPNQEAPTRICWSDMNRSALIRVPLAWSRAASLANQVNPPSPPLEKVSRQTVELRTPDGSALVHLLLSAITRIADEAFDDPTSAETARKRYVTAAGLKDQRVASTFPQLPGSCAEAASLLQRRRMLFEKEGMFPWEIIDYVLNLLRGEDDSHLARELWELGASDRDRAVRQLLHRDLHRH
jgi:glutamine synthetase